MNMILRSWKIYPSLRKGFFESISQSFFTGIGNVYRPPNSDIIKFTEIMESILKKISSDKLLSKAEEIQIMDDLNINLLKNNSHNAKSNFLSTC